MSPLCVYVCMCPKMFVWISAMITNDAKRSKDEWTRSLKRSSWTDLISDTCISALVFCADGKNRTHERNMSWAVMTFKDGHKQMVLALSGPCIKLAVGIHCLLFPLLSPLKYLLFDFSQLQLTQRHQTGSQNRGACVIKSPRSLVLCSLYWLLSCAYII